MAVNAYQSVSSSQGDGYAYWDGANAISVAYNSAGVRFGIGNTGTACGWFVIDNITKNKDYAPADAWIALLERVRPDGWSPEWEGGGRIHMTIHGVDEDTGTYPGSSAANWDTDHGLSTTAAVRDSEYLGVRAYNWSSINIAPIPTEICARAGWSSGNDMQFHLDGDMLDVGYTCYLSYASDTDSNRPTLFMVDAGEIWARPIGIQVNFGAYDNFVQSDYLLEMPVLYPPGMKIGETILAWVSVADVADITWPSGWTELTETDCSTTNTLSIAWHKVDGSEGKTFRITLDAVEEGVLLSCIRITNAADPTVTPPEVATATGTSTNPDPPSISPTGGSAKYMVLTIVGTDGYKYASVWSDLTPYYQTTDYDGLYTSLHSAIGWVESDAINPSAYTIAASEEWVAATVVVYPADSASSGTEATVGGVWGVE